MEIIEPILDVGDLLVPTAMALDLYKGGKMIGFYPPNASHIKDKYKSFELKLFESENTTLFVVLAVLGTPGRDGYWIMHAQTGMVCEVNCSWATSLLKVYHE